MSNLTGTDYTSTRARGHAPWKPHAETRAVLDDVLDVLDELVPQFGPQGNRGVAYRLTERGYVKDKKLFDRIDDISNRGRRGGQISWNDIYDTGFSVTGKDGYGGLGDFHESILRQAVNYRRDRQEGQPIRKMIWVEAAGMIGMANTFARSFSVPIITSGGTDSTHGKRLIALDVASHSRMTRIGVIADHDEHGLMIADSRTDDVSTFVNEFVSGWEMEDGSRFTGSIEWVWLGVRPDQIAMYGLQSKAKDARKQSVGNNAAAKSQEVQAEAMHPSIWRSIVRDFIVTDFDADAYVVSRRRERVERAEAIAAVSGMTFTP